ncbi:MULTISPECIES: hypothetical protein [Pseudomonas]|uniref:hypothetical protein n=1 Tax=Pseudomonas TaxID=286 RepID=UPI0025977D4F|nr:MULTISPECIES: hypothetical protein [Pseudomonas]
MSKHSDEHIKQTALKFVMGQIDRGEVAPCSRESLRKAIRQARSLALANQIAAAKVVSDTENALVLTRDDCLASSPGSPFSILQSTKSA